MVAPSDAHPEPDASRSRSDDGRSTRALEHGFAHRDDEHPNPLWDALSAGFRHIEMDVWHLFGRLLVAHDPPNLRPDRTFERLYLAPLVKAYEQRRLAPHDTVWLYLDVKTAARPAYRTIERVARAERRWIVGPTDPQGAAPIRLVLTGNRPPVTDLLATPEGVCHYDGRPPDLVRERDARFMPIVSADWSRFSRWRGQGPIPEDDMMRLRSAIQATRAAGQRLRFWATPDQPGPERARVWTALLDEGVDLLNTDDLTGLASFLRSRQRVAPASSSSSA